MTPTGTGEADPAGRRAEGSSAEPDCGGFHSARDARNQRHLRIRVVAFALAYLGATASIRWRERLPDALPWVLVGLVSILAVLTIRSYLRFLRDADELLRRIETEALAFGFGAGAMVSLLYPLAEGLGAPRLDGHAIAVVMMLAAAAGYWLGLRRYSGRGAR